MRTYILHETSSGRLLNPVRPLLSCGLWGSPMKILIFSDIHNDMAALDRLMDTEADAYIAAGDLTSWGRGLDRCGEVLRRRGQRVWVLPGNHEWSEQIAKFAETYGLCDFHEKTFEAGLFHVAGLGYSNPTPFHTPGEYSEAEIKQRLQPFAAFNPLVLICHCPPLQTPLDQVRQGLHAGSRVIREFIEKHQPRYFFCGHIHEAEGVSVQMGETAAVNVGKRGHLLELS